MKKKVNKEDKFNEKVLFLLNHSFQAGDHEEKIDALEQLARTIYASLYLEVLPSYQHEYLDAVIDDILQEADYMVEADIMDKKQ